MTTNPRNTRQATPVTRRRNPAPEVIRLVQGQAPKLPDASEATEGEPTSQVRPCWPERWAIDELFREAGRLNT